MARFITRRFLKRARKKGRILDGLRVLERLAPEAREALPKLPKLSPWECVLEEVLDTDHEPEYYVRFANELLSRGYSRSEICEMRGVAWETAGWLNFEMMAWEWCHLDESDMLLGLENRFRSGDIDRKKYRELRSKIEHYRCARPRTR